MVVLFLLLSSSSIGSNRSVCASMSISIIHSAALLHVSIHVLCHISLDAQATTFKNILAIDCKRKRIQCWSIAKKRIFTVAKVICSIQQLATYMYMICQ